MTENTETPDDYPEEAKASSGGRETPRTPFGWCLTGHHRDCRKTMKGAECSCERCGDDHGVDYRPLDFALPADLAAVIEKYMK